MERRGLEKGKVIGLQEGKVIGAKEISQKHIINILEKRFNSLPENLINGINQIEDLAVLDKLHLESITVNSIDEFEQLINKN
jgi:hypothetical protein